MNTPIRVGIVDDHPGVRVAIRDMLANAKDILVVGVGSNGMEALQLAEKEKPDVLLLDVELPILRGDEVAQRIQASAPGVKVLALSGYDDPVYILGMMEHGAAGYITKDEAPRMLLKAVRSVVNDQVKWISPEVARQVSQITLENINFTGVELEVLRYIALNYSDNEIGHALNLTQKSLEQHIKSLKKKFNVSSREKLKDAARQVISTTRETPPRF